MLQVATKAFGNIEINPNEILEFPDGLFGFQEYHRFALISDNEDSPFQWLQSLDESGLAFILIQPETFLKEKYKPEILSGDLEALHVKGVDTCKIYLIVTIPENQPEKMTANLQGPILFNEEKKIGRQAISLNDNHSVRFPILEYMDK